VQAKMVKKLLSIGPFIACAAQGPVRSGIGALAPDGTLILR